MLHKLDLWLLHLINAAHAAWLDQFMQVASEKWAWLPMYVLLILYLFLRYKPTRAALILVVITLLILATDQLSTQWLKVWTARLRPCHNPIVAPTLHLLEGSCGGMYGFVSSHAANSFGVALFLSRVTKWKPRWLFVCLFMWTTLLCYSRIYLGAHYPSDVTGGILLGAIFGSMAYYLLVFVEIHVFKPTGN